MRSAIRSAGVLVVFLAAAARAGEPGALVPWKVLEPGADPPKTQFTLFWVPSSPDAMRRSDLITSRRLLFYSGRCVAMHVVRVDDGERLAKLKAEKEPVAILVEGEKELARIAGDGAAAVEAMVREAIDTREVALSAMLDHASKADRDKAIELYRGIASQSCAFPREAKIAQRALRHLGVRD